ncbi:MAG: DUF1828 domain-containing protein [Planctomycetes bacterium]|nr:DUF1828 domain-containing protein [Planctomycetota bacterium]
MTTEDIIRSFRQKVCKEIELEGEGLNRYIVYTPFMFDDGDHFVIVLREQEGRWVLTDEGHTFLHLSYGGPDLTRGTRGKVIDQTLDTYRVANESGELRLTVPNGAYGDALFSFVQAISRIASTALWTRERVESTFRDDFRELLEATVAKEWLTFEYIDPEIDPEGNYPVDCRINGRTRQCFIFAVANTDQCRNATITVYHYERHARVFSSFVVFEDQTSINRRALAQLSDVVGRQFASLAAKDRITDYLTKEVVGADH